jgi:hypothetical protein
VQHISSVLHAGAVSFLSSICNYDNPLIKINKNSGTGRAEAMAFSFDT